MTVRTLNWPSGVRWQMDVQLDKRVFTFRAAYNTRMDTWALDLITGDGAVLLSGVRLVRGYPLLPPWRGGRFPQGQLFAVSPRGRADGDPRRGAFKGETPAFRLVYVEQKQ